MNRNSRSIWGRRGFLFALSGLATATTARVGSAADLTALPIGASSDPQNGALIIIAKQMDYFTDNGLDVSVKFFPSAGDLVAAMAAGALNVGAGGTVPTTTLRGGGFPLVVLAQQADTTGTQVVVANKEISAPKDFEGKKLGTLFGTLPQMFADAMLLRYNIPPAKVTLVNLGPSDMVSALLRGDIAGATLWEPWATQAVKGGAHRLLSGSYSFIPGQSGPNRLIGEHSLLVASKPYVQSNPAIISAVLKSLLAAERLIRTQPDKAAEILGKELKVPSDEMKTQMALNHYGMTIDAQLIKDMNAEADFLMKSGKLKTPVKAIDWVYTPPLRQISPALVTWGGV